MPTYRFPFATVCGIFIFKIASTGSRLLHTCLNPRQKHLTRVRGQREILANVYLFTRWLYTHSIYLPLLRRRIKSSVRV